MHKSRIWWREAEYSTLWNFWRSPPQTANARPPGAARPRHGKERNVHADSVPPHLLIAGSALPLIAIGTRAAKAADFPYKLATNLPSTHPMNMRLSEAAARIKAQTGSALDISMFPNSQLGTDTDMLSQVRSGALEFFTLSGLILSTLVPVAAINGVGFAFKDTAQALGAMDGPIGALVRADVAKRGLIAFEKIFDSGFRQITTSNRPINAPADLAGLKIRVRRRRSGPPCSRVSVPPPQRSTSVKPIPRCRRRLQMQKKIHCR